MENNSPYYNLPEACATLVVGASGSGKTQNFAKPAVLNRGLSLHEQSFVITDKNGEILKTCAPVLKADGYDVMYLNLTKSSLDGIDARACHYNPFAHIQTNYGLSFAVDAFYNVITDENEKHSLWTDVEKHLLTALLEAMRIMNLADWNSAGNLFLQVAEFLKAAPEHAENKLAEIDSLFEKIGEINFSCTAKKEYNIFSDSTPAHVKDTILLSLSSRLSVFESDFCKNLMSDDNIDFSALNNGKTAFFIIISPDSRYTFFTPMLLHQLFMFFLKSPSPEHPARFILDNFADIGYISGLFTCMGISERFKIDILAQSVSQICTLYGRSISELRKYFDTGVCFSSCFKEDAQYFESLSKVNISSMPKDKCLVCMNNSKRFSKKSFLAEKISAQ